MLRALAAPIKPVLLRLIHNRGYVVLRQTDFDNLLARVNSVQPPPTPAPTPQVQQEPSPPPPPSELVSDTANIEG